MNFTKEGLISFTNQYDAFQKRCKHIASIFAKYDCDYKYLNNSSWILGYNDEEDVSSQQIYIFNEADIQVEDYWFGIVRLSLPIEVLSYTDEQIEEYASKQLKK